MFLASEIPLLPHNSFAAGLGAVYAVSILSWGSEPIPVPEERVETIRILLRSAFEPEPRPFVPVADGLQ